jgi:hypothetical protein
MEVPRSNLDPNTWYSVSDLYGLHQQLSCYTTLSTTPWSCMWDSTQGCMHFWARHWVVTDDIHAPATKGVGGGGGRWLASTLTKLSQYTYIQSSLWLMCIISMLYILCSFFSFVPSCLGCRQICIHNRDPKSIPTRETWSGYASRVIRPPLLCSTNIWWMTLTQLCAPVEAGRRLFILSSHWSVAIGSTDILKRERQRDSVSRARAILMPHPLATLWNLSTARGYHVRAGICFRERRVETTDVTRNNFKKGLYKN